MNQDNDNNDSSSHPTREPDVDVEPTETTHLLAGHDRNDDGGEDFEDIRSNAHDPNPDERRRRPGRFGGGLSKERLKYAFLFAIPVLLLVPSFIFFVMTLNLRATMPPSSSLETIANLTRRVSHLSRSLSACYANTTQLAIDLHDEQQRVEICRENEKRLADRVDVVEGMLEKCQMEEVVLKKNLADVRKDLSVCSDEKEKLKKQMEEGVFFEFLEVVGKMGTGGDSWVCSDLTESWSHGYASTESPHSTITIQTWTSDLADVKHSAVPLVFPPDSLTSTSDSMPALPSPSFQDRLQKRTLSPVDSQRSDTVRRSSTPRIIGYMVSSKDTSGNNGWWRINPLPAFAIKGGKIEFFAQAAKWYKSKARFQVTVFWVENV